MNDFEKAMAEFLANGGKVETVPSGKSGIVPGQSNSPWGRKKSSTPVAEEVLEPEVIDLDELVEAEEAAADEDDTEE